MSGITLIIPGGTPMASSLMSAIVTRVRYLLTEAVASFWSDAELLTFLNSGIADLWRRLNNTYQDFFHTIDTTHVTQDANATTLTGVPTDVVLVRGLEPVSLTTYPNLRYEYVTYMDPKMQAARAQTAQDPGSGGVIYFAITGSGGPVASPTIHVAPILSAAIALRLVYVPTVPVVALTDHNPIPGESDEALIDWTLAHAITKDKDDVKPHKGWMDLYELEAVKIVVHQAPRQSQDDEFAEALFEPYW